MTQRYCLDTNVLIQSWNTYYSIKLCPEYWEILDDMARRGQVFCTQEVRREIDKTDDGLCQWVKGRSHLFRDVNVDVQRHLRAVLAKCRRLVDTAGDRSMADPWVVAHAIAEGATVVTKELLAPPGTKRIKIPNVCREFSVRCINDFEFLTEVGIRFTARRVP